MLERRVMQLDAEELSAFYGTGPGHAARHAILTRLKDFWPDLSGLRLLGYGFATPYLRAFSAERVIAASPAAMGIAPLLFSSGPREKRKTVLCEEDALPFADSLFDRVLIVHGLERAEALRPLLRQVWRVLAPEGRLLVVAPNRASLWAQVELSPFGKGRPFSHSELDRVLREALLTPERWERALYAPPLATRLLVRTGRQWERAGARFFPALGGVHLVEAKKSLYAAAPVAPVTGKTQAALLSPDF